jgi:hypothetical protein
LQPPKARSRRYLPKVLLTAATPIAGFALRVAVLRLW